MILAGVLKSPGLQLEQSEAHAIAEAALNVQRHYPEFQAAAKTIDWINLATVLVITYGTRIVAANKRKQESQAQPAAPSSQRTVIDFPTHAPPGAPVQ